MTFKQYSKIAITFIVVLFFYMAIFHEILHLIPCWIAGFNGSIVRLFPTSEVSCIGIQNSSLSTQFIYTIFPYFVDTIIILISLFHYRNNLFLLLPVIGLLNTLGNFFANTSDFSLILIRYGLNFYLLSALIVFLNSFLFVFVAYKKRKEIINFIKEINIKS